MVFAGAKWQQTRESERSVNGSVHLTTALQPSQPYADARRKNWPYLGELLLWQ